MFRRKRKESDFNAEIEAHLDLEKELLQEQGLSEEDARAAAHRIFGNVTKAKERFYESGHWLLWDHFWRDLRFAFRVLRKSPGFTAVVVITLALGIGANAAIFSVVRGILLRPLANRGEDRIVYIRQSAPGLGAENTTFSVPEARDFESRATTIQQFGEFSTVEFTMLGFGREARTVRAGVINGSFFDVMGLRPVLGRLLTKSDDRPEAAGVAVLTHRFWTTWFNADPKIIGKTIRLGVLNATIVGVLEPSVPYPADTEIIANIVTSPHHLGATMNTDREHRMTEIFGRLAPGVSLEAARAEITAIHAAIMREHPEAYSSRGDYQLRVTLLRDQIVAPARTILLILLASAGIVFLIACSNIANLILTRSVRREGELAVRAALGASYGALRRTLLTESLVLCCAGAIFGVVLAQPMVEVVSHFAARFSVRALEVKVDTGVLWIGACLAITAAVFLAFIPRLPSPHAPTGLGLASGSVRITPATKRRLRVFATIQIAFSFVLLAGAGTLAAALLHLQKAPTRFDMLQVLAVDIPEPAPGLGDEKVLDFSREAIRRLGMLPGVNGVAVGSFVPWRDVGSYPRIQFAVEGYTPANGEELPHARIRFVSPQFFAVLGIPRQGGRAFTDHDRVDSEPVVIVSESIAQRLFSNRNALNRKLWWKGVEFCNPCRIVGIVADADDENIVPGPAMTIYHPVQQVAEIKRLFLHIAGDPYALVPSVKRVIRNISTDQVVERAATLDDVRSEVLVSDRLNAFVVSGFATIALLISAVGIAGVLAFSVSARTREFAVRLAVGASPRHLLQRVLMEGSFIVAFGIVIGAAGGYVFAHLTTGYLKQMQMPGAFTLLLAATVLAVAAIAASLIPVIRASRVDVLHALRSE